MGQCLNPHASENTFGLEEIDDGIWNIYFGALRPRKIARAKDERSKTPTVGYIDTGDCHPCPRTKLSPISSTAQEYSRERRIVPLRDRANSQPRVHGCIPDQAPSTMHARGTLIREKPQRIHRHPLQRKAPVMLCRVGGNSCESKSRRAATILSRPGSVR